MPEAVASDIDAAPHEQAGASVASSFVAGEVAPTNFQAILTSSLLFIGICVHIIAGHQILCMPGLIEDIQISLEAG